MWDSFLTLLDRSLKKPAVLDESENREACGADCWLQKESEERPKVSCLAFLSGSMSKMAALLMLEMDSDSAARARLPHGSFI